MAQKPSKAQLEARTEALAAVKVDLEQRVDELKARIRRLEAARDAYRESREQLNVMWMQERARVEALEAENAELREDAVHMNAALKAQIDATTRLEAALEPFANVYKAWLLRKKVDALFVHWLQDNALWKTAYPRQWFEAAFNLVYPQLETPDEDETVGGEE